MRLVQSLLALLTIAAEVVFHLWWSGDTSPAVIFIRVDAPMIMAILGGVLAIAIAATREYGFTMSLVPVTALTLLGAGFGIVNPLAFPAALLLLLTTIACGLSMTSKWLGPPLEAHH